MLKILIGNIFKSKMQVLVNTVNCVGIMGKGIAKEFKKKHPDMFIDYKERCYNGLVKLGEPYIYKSNNIFDKTQIINFPTKKHWRSASKLTDIVNGLDFFIKHYKEWGIKSVAFPPLGCGNGGLEWEIVGKIMFDKLNKINIDVEIYAPFGTSSKLISKEFLSQKQALSKNYLKEQETVKINPNWIPILECVYQMQTNQFSPKIGRLKFQKIAYVLTELGVKSGFTFKQGSYGPYSASLKNALGVFANSNIIIEEKLGKMLNIKITNEYEILRKKHIELIEKYTRKIEMTKDLFERLKTTEQAEEATSIIYILRKLKTKERVEQVSDLEILQKLLEWKKHWNTKLKKESIIISIRNLAMLGWIKIKFDKKLDYVEIF